MVSRIKCAVSGNQHVSVQAPQWVYGAGVQRIPFSSTAVPSAALNSPLVRLYATSECLINVGVDPTAADDGTSFPLAEKTPWVETIEEGHKVSVISTGIDGVLYIGEAQKEGA